MGDKSPISTEQLKKLEPLSSLSDERLEELVSLSYVDKLPIGVSIFHEGDIDNQTVYLLEGDVQCTSSDQKIDKVISSKQDEAKYPLDDSQPRQVSCNALGRVELVRIDNSVLDYMMMWDQLAVSEETAAETEETIAKQENKEQQSKTDQQPKSKAQAEKKSEKQQAASVEKATAKTETSQTKQPAKQQQAKQASPVKQQPADQPSSESIPASDEDRSWIRKMRHIMAFKNMPPANIKSLLEKMETILVKKDDVVVSQGTEGDYYYVLTEGEAVVTRVVELATLSPGASFGEEALVSEAQRNASVTMKTDGMLMRLSKDNFNSLLKDPLLERVSPDDARQQVNKGAVWLDVRHAKEFSHARLPKALNIPLHEIRLRLNELDKDKNYICYCSTGRRSSAAAFLLVQNGYKASVLNGGIKVMAQDLVR
ncbi:MAG: cyclic nucleotide-binding domain-containing protein [Thioalkalispiraceae bacterium]|jgi:rhodanese-related sulfurtransferase